MQYLKYQNRLLSSTFAKPPKQPSSATPFPRQLFDPKQLARRDQQQQRQQQQQEKSLEHAVPNKPNNRQESQPELHKPLVRDFIHDSLYNPTYGYFSKRAVIFSQPDPVDFTRLRNMEDFEKCVASLYKQYDEFQDEDALQVWHTPTELFKPWYGYAVANYLLNDYLTSDDYTKHGRPLTIYEMGAGNGTLMCNILDYLRMNAPKDVYKSTRYNIIEISKQLSERQQWNNMSRVHQQASEHEAQVQIINKSVFEWSEIVEDPCYFIAFEVIDNFAHDLVRYNLSSDFDYLAPMQTRVVLNDTDSMIAGGGEDYSEEYQLVSDPLIKRYLDYRTQAGHVSPLISNRKSSSILQFLSQKVPFAPNLTAAEFIPTMQLFFMEILRDKFPRHKLILSDFDSLPTEVEGLDAPVVQTRQRHRMIPCSTYLVTPGWFDIFFPTNFQVMSDVYGVVMDQKSMSRHRNVLSHREFMQQYANVEKTRTKLGDIPILDYYQNVSFFLTK